MNTLYNMDCMEGMKEIPDKFFDLAIVDPPYGINANKMKMGSHPNRSTTDGYGSGPSISTSVRLKGRLNSGSGKLKNRLLNNSAITWDNETPSHQYFQQLFRISKDQIIWGGNYFQLPPTRCIECWDKLQPWDNFSQWEMAWTSFDKPAGMFKYSNTGGANKEKKIHPTQKPVALYKWLLRRHGKGVLKVLDTHAGSCSSIIACIDAGIEWMAFEKEILYFQDALDRLKNHQSQLRIAI